MQKTTRRPARRPTATKRAAPKKPDVSRLARSAGDALAAARRSEKSAKGWATRRAKQAKGPAAYTDSAGRLHRRPAAPAETGDPIGQAPRIGTLRIQPTAPGEAIAEALTQARAAEAAAGPSIAQRAMAIGEQRDQLMASARDTGFAFRLGQRVTVNADTVATVIGRADHEVGTCEYLCHYRQADGREVERWWPEEILSAEL